MQRESLYWDDFNKRIVETVQCIKNDVPIPIRRVAVFLTDACNFRCRYCNVSFGKTSLPQSKFEEVLDRYGTEAIYHVTGGEPATVKWLFPFLKEHGDKYRFHLNTNGYLCPPAKSVKRLKVSLDSTDPKYWNDLVGRKDAFAKVIDTIKRSVNDTVVSITYCLNKHNYKQCVDFARFSAKEFPGLYAVFFSVYKGSNPEFAWNQEAADDFFSTVLPSLKNELDEESMALISETIDEKVRIIQGIRFPENGGGLCYLSMSERVIGPSGRESRCSHLYRDNIFQTDSNKCDKCLYGCNRRLVKFNELVQQQLES